MTFFINVAYKKIKYIYINGKSIENHEQFFSQINLKRYKTADYI